MYTLYMKFRIFVYKVYTKMFYTGSHWQAISILRKEQHLGLHETKT